MEWERRCEKGGIVEAGSGKFKGEGCTWKAGGGGLKAGNRGEWKMKKEDEEGCLCCIIICCGSNERSLFSVDFRVRM